MKPIQFMKNEINQVRNYARSAKTHGSDLIDKAGKEIMSTEKGRRVNAVIDNNAGFIVGTGMVGTGTLGLTTFADPIKTEW